MSDKFLYFPEASKFLAQLIKAKKADCKRLALEENDEGKTPLNAYFNELKLELTDYRVRRFHGQTWRKDDEQAKKFIVE